MSNPDPHQRDADQQHCSTGTLYQHSAAVPGIGFRISLYWILDQQPGLIRIRPDTAGQFNVDPAPLRSVANRRPLVYTVHSTDPQVLHFEPI